MLDLSWGDFDNPIQTANKTKKCRYCKLVKPHYEFGRWPDCEDGHHYFCTECWEGFCRQGNAYDKETLMCFKCDKPKPVAEFYKEHVFGTRAPWCNLCRAIFIAEHASPKPLRYAAPKQPRLYTCDKCRDKKPESEFETKEDGNRYQRCRQCRDQISQQYIALRKSAEENQRKNISPRQKRHLHRLQNTGTQICNACDAEKPLTDFPLASTLPLGVYGTCKECKRAKFAIKSKERKIAETENPPPIPGDTFQCRKCKQNKPLTEFAKAPGRKEGHDLWCKECSKERKRKWHENHPAPSWEQKAADRCNKRAREKGLPSGMKPADLYDPNTGALPIFCPIFPDTRLDYQAGFNRRAWASVDRKIPALGYVSDNVWVISNSANTWKSNGGNEKDKKIIEKLTRNGSKIKILDNPAQNSLFD